MSSSSSSSSPLSKSNASACATSTSNGFVPQNYDYFLVLDFEATCDSGTQPSPQEIIEFPCLKVSAKTFEVESKFHHYVRPTAHPVLSEFCTDLTGIIQEMVDDQADLPETLRLFHEWLIEENLLGRADSADSNNAPHSFLFVTCGDWDLKSMLPRQAAYLNLTIPPYLKKWMNIKKAYNKAMGSFPRGMMVMLSALDIAHQGRHHSGIDDCANIASILKKLAEMGVHFKQTGSVE
uniref:Exonuclease domain-containing protein n=1 Tax=Plectus sambesii TaxID=2011161 RepID=A0A914WHH6_9BILA